MPRPKRDEILRHEKPEEEVFIPYHDDEDGFLPIRDSGVVLVNAGLPSQGEAKSAGKGKGKRSLEDMMASMPNSIAQSGYALERIAALEDQIAKVLTLCSPEARNLVLGQRPSLKRYAPEE